MSFLSQIIHNHQCRQNLSYVGQLATRLDKTGDANDKEGTQANWDKLEKILSQLRALYQISSSN